ncbi:MAG: amidohydrolase [Flavobacteriales bacterium]|nr:amidohydrolase [Flavobacteriales bacterium]
MNHLKTGCLLLLPIFLLNSCVTTEEMDLLIHNAKIYTVNDAFDVQEAMVIKDGIIVDIGPQNEILNKYTAKEVVDAGKKPIYPGFIDAHCHFVGYAQNLNEVNLVGTSSFEEVVERVSAFAQTNQSEWIVGRGWDQNDWEVKEFPMNDLLDSLFPSTPVFLTRIDGHAALANSTALNRAGIDHNTRVDGGIITFKVLQNNTMKTIESSELTDYSQLHPKPTGILIDNAVNLVSSKIPGASQDQLRKSLLKAQQNLVAVGLTTVDDAGLDRQVIELIEHMQADGDLKLKVYAMISGTKEMLEHYLEAGPHKTKKLNVCSFKFYADGALGSRGACLLEPYSDILEQLHHGLLTTNQTFFETYAPLLYEKGFQMNTHCIGDSANRMILNIYAKVLGGVNDKRWRIEHAQVVHPADLEKFKAFTIIPSVQPTHATSDMYWAQDRLGEERVKSAYAYNDLLSQNGLLALGTDFPVEGINPMNTFYAAVVRKDLNGFPENGYQVNNALSRKDALKGITIWAAIANFEENEKGSLEIGKAADFVMLDNDLMDAEEADIPNIRVLSTYIDGERVYTLKK